MSRGKNFANQVAGILHSWFVCNGAVSPAATYFLALPRKYAKRLAPAARLILQCSRCAGRVNVARMLRCRYAECAPETRLRPHNTARFGAGTRGVSFLLRGLEVIRVNLLDFVHVNSRHSNVVINHQIRQLSAIDQDDFCVDEICVFKCITRE